MRGLRRIRRMQPEQTSATPPWTQDRRPAPTAESNWENETEALALALRERREPDRWRELLVVTASPQQDQAMNLVAALWAAPLPFEFRALATALIQQRIEDGLPVPTDPGDPLRKELEAMLTGQMRRSRQAG
jgi:hypothetical protein